MPFNHPLYKKLENYDFYLASTSPRRLEILQNNLKVENVKVIPSDFEENLLKADKSPSVYVEKTSKRKGEAVLKKLQSQGASDRFIVVSSDTIISCDNRVFEKPGTKDIQLSFFHKYKLNPRIQVITSVNVIRYEAGTVIYRHGLETTDLYFNESLSDEFLQHYVDSEEGLNVAGGFKYQCLGSLLFKRLDGDYFNVVGLPVAKTFQVLEDALK